MIGKGILFGDTHSYYDLNLILSKKEIPPAKAKTTYIDVPGADGSIDLTEAHGEVKYSDRECTFTFSVLPSETMSWEEKMTEISNKLNGLKCKITLDNDEDYYYLGRCTVDSHSSDRKLMQFVVKAKVAPYKLKQYVTNLTFKLTETPKAVDITNSRKSVSPSIECSNDNTVIVFGTSTFNLSAGTHKILDIRFVEGNNSLTISGTGTVKISFQEGDL